MTNKNTPVSKRQGQRQVDLDVASILIGERSVGEIFGWDLVDWQAIEPYKSRRFHFERQRRLEPCIYDQLKPLFDRCRPESGDFQLLKPSPLVNDNLSKLVSYLCRHFGDHHLPSANGGGAGLQRTAEQEELHQGVTGHILGRIDTEAELGQRAATLKTIAAAAECELEIHFADQINSRIERDFFAGGVADKNRISSLKDQARARIEETRKLNDLELVGLSRPDLLMDDDNWLRIEMAKILLHRFPYVRNYELMLFAELAMLQQPLAPRLLPDHGLGLAGGPIDQPGLARFDRAVAGIAAHLGFPPGGDWSSSLSEKTIAFCGSGSLPLSPILLHLMTGAGIILVDNERRAVERSERLIANLERLNILPSDALTVTCRDAGEAAFQRLDATAAARATAGLGCDAVMVASLVDPTAKDRIVRRFRERDDAPAFLVMRSSKSLSARLAYDPVATAEVTHPRLAYCGETLPATQIATHLDRLGAIRRGGITGIGSPDLLAIAHPEVVNSTEIYRSCRLPGHAEPCDFSEALTLPERCQQFEAIRASLDSEHSAPAPAG